MAEVYEARCWGGPLDGRIIAAQRPELQAARPARLRPTMAGDDPLADVEVMFRTDCYRYVWLRVYDDVYGCWIVTAPRERVEAIQEEIMGSVRLILWMAGR